MFYLIACDLSTLFYKNNFIKHEAHFCSKFKNKLKAIPALAEEQSLKFSIIVVNKIAASVAQFAKCILIHAYSRTTAASSCAKTNKTSYSFFNKLLA